MSRAPKARGRSWERQVAEMVDGIRLGRPHEPDVVTQHLVIECKNEQGLAVSARAITQARESTIRGPGLGRQWAVFKRRKGEHSFTVTMDGKFAVQLLRDAGYIE